MCECVKGIDRERESEKDVHAYTLCAGKASASFSSRPLLVCRLAVFAGKRKTGRREEFIHDSNSRSDYETVVVKIQ